MLYDLAICVVSLWILLPACVHLVKLHKARELSERGSPGESRKLGPNGLSISLQIVSIFGGRLLLYSQNPRPQR